MAKRKKPGLRKTKARRREDLQKVRRLVATGAHNAGRKNTRPKIAEIIQDSRGGTYEKLDVGTIRRVDPRSVEKVKKGRFARIVHAVRHTRSLRWREKE